MTWVSDAGHQVRSGRDTKFTLLRWAGLALSALSMTALAQRSWSLEVGRSFENAVAQYDHTIQLLLGWLGNWLQMSGNSFDGAAAHDSATVWMHFFVVLAPLFLADARTQLLHLPIGDRTTNTILAAVSACYGLLLALVCSIAAGTVWASPTASWSVVAPALVLIAAHLLFWLVNLVRDVSRFGWLVSVLDYWDDIRIGLALIVIGGATAALSPIVAAYLAPTVPGIVPVAIYLLMFAFYFIGRFCVDRVIFGSASSYSTLQDDPEGWTGANLLLAVTLASCLLLLDKLALFWLA